ncbi:MAG: hypothetical protein ABFD96_19725 [Armatimonadia bacterium]
MSTTTAPMPGVEEFTLRTWFERDRQHVRLQHTDTQTDVVEWWDGDVTQAVEDGFLDTSDFIMGRERPGSQRLKVSAYEYARDRGLLNKLAERLHKARVHDAREQERARLRATPQPRRRDGRFDEKPYEEV